LKPLVIGTAGHVDHGKTTLVRALTGVDTDRLKEEKERGLTIDLGFAHLELTPDIRAAVVDVPGHHDFLTNMLAGSTGIDAVLLVVSAQEGPMPQTREHLQIAHLLGVHRGVIALTHIDRVDPEFAELAAAAAADEVEEVTGQGWPVIGVDATRGEGIDALRQALVELARQLPEPVQDPVFRLPVDRSFTVSGTGTVITGTVWSGSVATGDRVRILPSGIQARVRGLQEHGEAVDQVGARRRCAASLVGVGRDQVRRGDTVVLDQTWSPTKRLGVSLELLPGSTRPVEHGQRLRLFVGTRETMARVLLGGPEVLLPGESAPALLECEAEVVVRAGDPFIMRFYSPVELLGGGRVLELEPPRKWRERSEDWMAIQDGSPRLSVEAALRLAGPAGLVVSELRLASPHSIPASLPADWSVVALGARLFDPAQLRLVSERLEDWLNEAHERSPLASGLPLESLRAAAGASCAPVLVEAALERLVLDGRIVIDGPRVRSADHGVQLDERESELRDGILAALDLAGLMPPTPAELASQMKVPPPLATSLLKLLIEDGRVIRLTPDILLTSANELALRQMVLEVFVAVEEPAPSDFREALGISRRYLIPMLEYLDSVGVSERSSSGRIPGPAIREEVLEKRAR
jgi:selenocysteine-specific elongation factor